MNLNKVFLVGNLTRDPELKSLPSGQAVVNFGLATNRIWKDRDGNQQKKAEFHNIVMFGKLAEIAKQYIQKGSMILVEGRLQTRSWKAQDGTTKYRTEIIAESMQMGPRRTGQPSSDSPPPPDSGTGNQAPEELATVEYPDDDVKPDDIPF